MLIRVYDVTYVEIKFNRTKFRNFTSSWEVVKMIIKMVKMTIKLCKSFFFHKIPKDEMLWAFVGMTSFTLDSKLCDFITSWELNKTPQTLCKAWCAIKTEVDFWPQLKTFSFWKELFWLFYKLLQPFLTFIDYEGPYLAQRFLHNPYPCFNIVFA